jgi:molybdate transport system regulatory protein
MTAKVRFKVWVEDERGVILSEWRVDLLAAVDETGSLTRAAEQVDVPYRTAWERIREMEASVGEPLVETASGGREGGGSHLTPAGRDLVARFRRMTSGLEEEIEARFETSLRERLDG